MFYSTLASQLSLRALRLSPFRRRSLLIAADMVLIPLSVWLSFWLRLADPWSPHLQDSLWMFPFSWLIAIVLYPLTGQYTALTRYVGSAALYRIATRNGLLVLLLAMAGVLLQLALPPRTSWFLLWFLLTGLTGTVRFALRDVLLKLQDGIDPNRLRVVIYGAGAAGAQLAASLRLAGGHIIKAFIDDSPHLWRRSINGIAIFPPADLKAFASDIDQVLLAMPSTPRRQRKRIIETLQLLGIPVLQVPSIEEITSGTARIDSLRPIPIEELLGRDTVLPDPQLLSSGIQGRVVCVTGAAGSIGSELSRQILVLQPKSLILIEHNEPSLYALEQELSRCNCGETHIRYVLATVSDASLLRQLFAQHSVEIVFHAAAYKHVPLVESNPLAGLSNNILATSCLCEAAVDCHVNRVILISTDKAVRPTNVMGASKRVAELIFQAWSQEFSHSTCFAMVRFGNVLGSSGSVVPLFRRQIASGGPITITHPDIVRYFMTIPEATQLVLQSARLARGGDVFLLDMGEPVLIQDLARQMVRLSGLTLRSAENPDGDIEITFTGLRPGEKLYEELLIDADSQPTSHPLIYRAKERSLPPAELWPLLDALRNSVRCQDVPLALYYLSQLVPEWRPTVHQPADLVDSVQ